MFLWSNTQKREIMFFKAVQGSRTKGSPKKVSPSFKNNPVSLRESTEQAHVLLNSALKNHMAFERVSARLYSVVLENGRCP